MPLTERSLFSAPQNPYVMLVEYDSISGNSRFGNLKELAVFSVEREGLALVRDNYPQLFQG